MPGKMIIWAKEFREGTLNPVVDSVRGVFPFLSNSGYAAVGSNGLFTSVLLVPSSKRFVMQGFWVDNSQDPNYFVLYDGGSVSVGVVTLPPFRVAQSHTDIVPNLNIPFQSGVYISTGTSTITIRVWGVLIDSINQ